MSIYQRVAIASAILIAGMSISSCGSISSAKSGLVENIGESLNLSRADARLAEASFDPQTQVLTAKDKLNGQTISGTAIEERNLNGYRELETEYGRGYVFQAGDKGDYFAVYGVENDQFAFAAGSYESGNLSSVFPGTNMQSYLPNEDTLTLRNMNAIILTSKSGKSVTEEAAIATIKFDTATGDFTGQIGETNRILLTNGRTDGHNMTADAKYGEMKGRAEGFFGYNQASIVSGGVAWGDNGSDEAFAASWQGSGR